MTFIPPISLIYRVLHHSQPPINSKINENYEHQETKNEKVREKKSTIPYKCTKCYYNKAHYCKIRNESIEELESKIVENCDIPEKLKKQRAKLQESSWSPINIILLKALLSTHERAQETETIYKNLESITTNFKIWEILTILAYNQSTPLLIESLTYDDYFKVMEKYSSFENNLEKISMKTNIPKCNTEENYDYDYATIILLQNYLSTFKDNDNIDIYQDELSNISNAEDIETIIELLYEENLLSNIDYQLPKQYTKK